MGFISNWNALFPSQSGSTPQIVRSFTLYYTDSAQAYYPATYIPAGQSLPIANDSAQPNGKSIMGTTFIDSQTRPPFYKNVKATSANPHTMLIDANQVFVYPAL